MKRILDIVADPKKMYVDERIPFYSLRRRLAARADEHPERVDEMIMTLHELIHKYQGLKSQ